MSALGNLVVSLTAETAQFRSGMERAAYQAQKSFGSIQRDARTLVGALAGYFSVQMFASWVKGAIDAADALNDLSERTGVASDKLSKFQYAAKLSDVTAEEFGSNLIKFNRSIAEAARGTGEAQKAFDAMGVSVKDSSGNIKATDVLLAEVADKFTTYADGANKTALATALFGRAGAGMITFLNLGSKGLAEMGRELERLGGVVMPEAARRAGEFNDNLDRLKAASSAAGLEIGNQLIPYINDLVNQFLLARKHGLQFVDVLQLGLTNPFGNIQTEIRDISRSLEEAVQRGDKNTLYAQSLERRAAYLRELAQVQALSRATGDFSDQISRRMDAQARAAKAQAKRDAPALAEEKKTTINDEAAKLIERQALAVQKLTLSDEELAVAEVFLAGATMQQLEASQRLADALANQNRIQKELKDQADSALEVYAEYKRLYEETASPAQKLADEEARLLALRERLIENGYDVAAVEKMIAEARMNAADKLFPPNQVSDLEKLKEIAQQFSAAIGTAFEDAVLRGNSLRDVIKGLEQDILRIVMRSLVTKPLERAIEGAIGGAVGGGGGSFWSTIFGGPRASGGLVVPGQAYLVGESGPELFMPNQSSGTIVPNDRLGNSTVININVSGVSGGEDMRRSAGQVAAMAALAISRGQRNL